VVEVESLEMHLNNVASDSNNEPAVSIAMFEAQVTIMNHPSQIAHGYFFVLDCHSNHVACRFDCINEKMDRLQGSYWNRTPNSSSHGQFAL
jgi:elongation factor 1-alpha